MSDDLIERAAEASADELTTDRDSREWGLAKSDGAAAIREYIRLTSAEPGDGDEERAWRWFGNPLNLLVNTCNDGIGPLAAEFAEVRRELVELMREVDAVLQGHMIGLNCHGPVMSDDLAKRWRAAIADRRGGGE